MLFFHEGFHEGHLSHCAGDRTDDQGWAEDFLVSHDYLIDIWLKLVLDPKGERCYIILRHCCGVALLLFRIYLLLLLFHSFKDSLDILSGSLDVGELQAFVGRDLLEDVLLDVGVGDQNGDFVFCQRVDVRVVYCCKPTRCG